MGPKYGPANPNISLSLSIYIYIHIYLCMHTHTHTRYMRYTTQGHNWNLAAVQISVDHDTTIGGHGVFDKPEVNRGPKHHMNIRIVQVLVQEAPRIEPQNLNLSVDMVSGPLGLGPSKQPRALPKQRSPAEPSFSFSMPSTEVKAAWAGLWIRFGFMGIVGSGITQDIRELIDLTLQGCWA